MLRATLSLALAATLIVGAPWTMLFAAPTDASGNASFALPFDPATLPVPVTTIYAQAASPAITFGVGGPPTFGFCVSDVDSFTVGS